MVDINIEELKKRAEAGSLDYEDLSKIVSTINNALTTDAEVVTPQRDYATLTPADNYEAGLLDGGGAVRDAIKKAIKQPLSDLLDMCSLIISMNEKYRSGEAYDAAIGKLESLQSENAKLRQDVETERLRLAVCGVAALGYFEGCKDEYKSASLDDVLRLRQELEEARKKAELYDALRSMHWSDGKLAVVAAKDLPLGVQTYSGDLLDAEIAARQKQG